MCVSCSQRREIKVANIFNLGKGEHRTETEARKDRDKNDSEPRLSKKSLWEYKIKRGTARYFSRQRSTARPTSALWGCSLRRYPRGRTSKLPLVTRWLPALLISCSHRGDRCQTSRAEFRWRPRDRCTFVALFTLWTPYYANDATTPRTPPSSKIENSAVIRRWSMDERGEQK